MKNENTNETKIIIVCTLGIICVVIIAILLLIGIWTDNDVKDVVEDEVTHDISFGNYQYVSWTSDEQVSKYSSEIISCLAKQDIDKLYDMTNPEYLECFNLDKEQLKNKIINKGLFGAALTTKKARTTTLYNSRYIKLNISSLNSNLVEGYINIIEDFPNTYKIAFDNFVFYKKEPITFYRENLVITLSEQIAYDSKYNVKISITNNSNDVVYINSNRAYDYIYLVNKSGSEVSVATHINVGKTVEILQNQVINLDLSFSIDDMAIGTIQSIKLKDVVASKTGVATDLVINI